MWKARMPQLLTSKILIMPLSLDDYRAKLINHILYAQSQEEVNSFIAAAMAALEQNKVKESIISRFVDKAIAELAAFNPMNNDAQHWSNIRIARILFNRIKYQLNAPLNEP
jgi:hypothetical protein